MVLQPKYSLSPSVRCLRDALCLALVFKAGVKGWLPLSPLSQLFLGFPILLYL